MRNKIITAAVVIVITLLIVCGLHGCGDTIDGTSSRALPNTFHVKERVFFKWGDTFDVSADGVNYGTVSQKLVSWKHTLNYDDNTGARSAVGAVAILSWGTQIEVDDAHGHRIGTIKEEVYSSLLKAWTTYRILDANGNQVAVSQKSEFFSTTFEMTANDGHVIATMHRPAFNWSGDDWEVTIKDSSVVDPRMELMIAAFKTTADNAKKKADNAKKHSSDDHSSSSKK